MNTATASTDRSEKVQDVVMNLKPGQPLYHRDNPAYHKAGESPFCFQVLSGMVALSRTDTNSKTTTFSVVTTGKFFGEETLLGDRRHHDARALVATTVRKVVNTSDIVVALVRDSFDRWYFLEKLYATRVGRDRMRLLESRYVDITTFPQTVIAEMLSASRVMVYRVNGEVERSK